MDLKKYYNDPKFVGALGGERRFYNEVKKIDPSITLKKVQQYLRSDDGYTLHKPVRKPQRYRRVYTKRPSYLYQLDLVDMSALSRKNNGYKWIINCIDTFSKKLWSFKTKNKRGITITNALKPLLTKNKPLKIETDGGTEFKNIHFKALLQKLKIQTYSIYSRNKACIVERVNRTMKTRMYRYFTARGTHKWYDILKDLVDSYNNSYHSSIKRTPNQVNARNEAEVRAILYPKQKPRSKPKFSIDSNVRISRIKSVFQKGYEQSWSYEVFKISEVQNTNPVTYKIQDFNGEGIKGSFYESELLLVDKSSNIYPIERVVRRRKTRNSLQYLVKYIGYPDIFNSWVNQGDLFKL